MINDRIRHIAQGLVDLDVAFESRNLHVAMNGSNPAETLRAVFLSLRQTVGVGNAVSHYAKELIEALGEGDDVPDARALLMMEILEDEDMLPLAERAQGWDMLVEDQHVADMVRFESLTALIDRVWAPKVSGSEAAGMWSEVVQLNDDVQADRLLARTVPDGIPFREMIAGAAVKNVRALDLLVERMSSAAVVREIKSVLKHVEEEDGGADHALHDALAILGAHHVRRCGSEDGLGAKVMSTLLDRAYNGVRAGEQFAQLALAVGAHQHREFFAVLRSTEVRKVSAGTLQRMLERGVPPSKVVGKSLVHLLEEPGDTEQCRMLWGCMDAKQREHFLRETLPEQLTYLHNEWRRRFDSVLKGNPLVWLHEAGADLGRSRRYGGRAVPLHEAGAVRDDEAREWVFLSLQAAGAYDSNVRYGGRTALHLAAQLDDCPAIRALLELGHDVNATSIGSAGSNDGETALVTAARAGKARAVRALIDGGADTGVKTGSGRSLMQVTRDDNIRRLINSARSADAVGRAMPGGEMARPAPQVRDMGEVL